MVEGVRVDVGRIPIDRARAVSVRAMNVWSTIAMHDGVPAFTGGILDAWPAWAVDAIAVARQESHVIRAFYEGGGLNGG